MKKILVIEDNLEVRENLCEILELSGYEVHAAENGKIGIEQANAVMPDIILCDVMMPVLDGFGVLKILNKSPKINHIPLIFLTAKAEKTDMRKGMGLGAEDYITKPFDDVELLEAIEIRLKKAERIGKSFDQTENGLQAFFSEAKANEAFEDLSMDKEIRKYSKKDMIFEEGQNARWLYFIINGQVKIYQTNEYGKELTTQLHNEGEFFGYFPLINEQAYSNNAGCTSDVTLQLIPKEDFAKLLFNNRDFSAQFIKMLANKGEETESKLIDMAYSSVRKKVANALVAFAKNKKGVIDKDKVSINASRDDLAALAGTAKETLIRTLSDFKSEGLIEVDGKAIVIHDLSELDDLIG